MTRQRAAIYARVSRSRIAERVQAGLARARKQGKRLGRPRSIRLYTSGPKVQREASGCARLYIEGYLI